MHPWTAAAPTGPAIPTALLGIPQLTGEPGDEVRNEPGYSCGARRGRGAVGVWGAPHLPFLLAWSRAPGWPGHARGRPRGPQPHCPICPAASAQGLPGQGGSLGWPGARALSGAKGGRPRPDGRLSRHRPSLLAASPAPSPQPPAQQARPSSLQSLFLQEAPSLQASLPWALGSAWGLSLGSRFTPALTSGLPWFSVTQVEPVHTCGVAGGGGALRPGK